MLNQELKNHIYDFTLTEHQRKISNYEIPSRFYNYLDSINRKDENGIYHLPPSNYNIPINTLDQSIWAKLDSSPRQNLFRIKKASRFYKEPFAYADFIAIRYVYSGNTTLFTPKENIALYTNDICMLNRGFVFSQYLPEDEDIVFTLMFEREFLLKNITNRLKTNGVIARLIIDYIMENKNPQNYILFHGSNNDRIKNIIENILCEYIDPTPYGETLVESYLQILFIEMLGCQFEYSNNFSGKNSSKIIEILDYINNNYQDVSLNDIANKFGYNPKYISRLIKTSTNKNFKDYILEKRMAQVETYLKNSNLSIHEIMLQTGLTNETYFYKKFKELYGMSPSDYRKSQQAN